jgi:hypothetical protein
MPEGELILTTTPSRRDNQHAFPSRSPRYTVERGGNPSRGE